MFILGISAFFHDSAAVLLRNGDLVAAAQEERFSRVKFDYRFPKNAIAFCLHEAGIESRDLDYVAFYEKPLPKFERILTSYMAAFPSSLLVFREAMIAWLTDKLWLKTMILNELSVPPERVLFIDHHMSHAASAMFCSPFKSAAVLTVDGVGEWATTSFGRATADWGDGSLPNRIDLVEEIRFPHSIGLLYSAFTAWLGFKVNSGEYKVMGMAAYGQPRYMEKVEKLIHVYSDGSFHLNMDYFSFHYSPNQTYNQKFINLIGPARKPESLFFTRATALDPQVQVDERQADQNQYYADIAASIQRLTEDLLIKMAYHIHYQTGEKNLVMAGGVALNSVANGRLMRETPFEHFYIQPNAGDAGGALGAAMYVYHCLLGKPRQFTMEHAYFGQSFSDSHIQRFLDGLEVRYERIDDPDRLASRIVDFLVEQHVVGLFQGRSEWGPRALGNRSILADPRHSEMKNIVNSKIKFRELFRPFAPVIIESEAPRYFDLGKTVGQYPQRFMLMVSPVFPERQAEIAAVSHMGTGRLQTVRPEWNPLYYSILEHFGHATSVPVLLNTSFNLRAEPIVNTPEDAFQTFRKSDLDLLVLGNFLVKKDDLR